MKLDESVLQTNLFFAPLTVKVTNNKMDRKGIKKLLFHHNRY